MRLENTAIVVVTIIICACLVVPTTTAPTTTTTLTTKPVCGKITSPVVYCNSWFDWGNGGECPNSDQYCDESGLDECRFLLCAGDECIRDEHCESGSCKGSYCCAGVDEDCLKCSQSDGACIEQQQDFCKGKECSGHGECKNQKTTYQCICENGYQGNDCEIQGNFVRDINYASKVAGTTVRYMHAHKHTCV